MLPASFSKGTEARTWWGILRCWSKRKAERVRRAAEAMNQTLEKRMRMRERRVIGGVDGLHCGARWAGKEIGVDGRKSEMGGGGADVSRVRRWLAGEC